MLHVIGEDKAERLDVVPAQYRVIGRQICPAQARCTGRRMAVQGLPVDAGRLDRSRREINFVTTTGATIIPSGLDYDGRHQRRPDRLQLANVRLRGEAS